MQDLNPRFLERVVYSMAIVDTAMLVLLTYVTYGFESAIFWLYLAVIVRNAAVIPHADVQALVNLVVCGAFLVGGFMGERLDRDEADLTAGIGLARRLRPAVRTDLNGISTNRGPNMGSSQAGEPLATLNPTVSSGLVSDEPISEWSGEMQERRVLRVLLLLMVAVLCFGLQKLVDRQRLSELEAQEFGMKQQQLQSAGRLAAEIAHQLKNPLGIINNAAWSLQHAVPQGQPEPRELAIIREEIQKSDRILTDLMGYARLAEGRVEKVDVTEELEQAIETVLPSGAGFAIEIHRDYALGLPSLAVQRGHFAEVFRNLLANAREAMEGKGEIFLTIRALPGPVVVVTVRDTGPGIPDDQLEKIFEPYFTTKKKGTGLGLAIVKHNIELYGGSVRVESELGSFTRFTINLPARTILEIRT